MTMVRRLAIAAAAVLAERDLPKRFSRTAMRRPPTNISMATKWRESVTMWRSLKSQMGAGSGMGSTFGKPFICKTLPGKYRAAMRKVASGRLVGADDPNDDSRAVEDAALQDATFCLWCSRGLIYPNR